MTDKRPVNLDIGTIQLPVTAYASILHRISGVILVGAIVVLLWMLERSLASEQSFQELKNMLSGWFAKLIVWGILAALLYHLVAGIRHLIMDLGIGESLEGGQLGARIVLLLSIILIVLAGGWVWIG